ncbi:hypothetical protein KJI95_07530 [Shewanella sp. JM162201]|uniref:DUF4177 domain-containing protein n=1 Tax=Shewanella jiangmenensis TaxID=2837387 RepID=A0ABS5V438_9GAMM|nr:hypothetical protein [Shewanella jiangmenensis]MBT1444376.1 hypothetical protein [Shewanella jiangmenensis]
MNKVVYVPSHFKILREAPGEAWSDGKGPEYSDSVIDGERLAGDIAAAVEAMNAEGYEVQSVMPVTSGHYDFADNRGSGLLGGGGYGYGFSYTQGVTLIGRKFEAASAALAEAGADVNADKGADSFADRDASAEIKSAHAPSSEPDSL